MTAIRAELLATLRAALAAGGISAAELARRAHLSQKTIRRLRAGRSVSDHTLESLADALGVTVSLEQLDADLRATIREVLAESGGGDSEPHKTPQNPTRPICGWEQAALRLGIHHETLRRHRRASGDGRAPWWRSEEDLFEWYETVRDAIVSTKAHPLAETPGDVTASPPGRA